MPIVTVYGLPADMNEEAIQALYHDLMKSSLRVKEMRVTADMVTIWFPAERMQLDLGKEITIIVVASKKPERTDEVRARLAQNLGETVKKHLPDAVVECLLMPFDPAQGFWLSSA